MNVLLEKTVNSIKQKEEEILRLNSLKTYLVNNDKLIKIDSELKKLREEVDELNLLLYKDIKEKTTEELHRTILFKKYIEKKKTNIIAEEVGYCERQVQRIIKKYK